MKFDEFILVQKSPSKFEYAIIELLRIVFATYVPKFANNSFIKV